MMVPVNGGGTGCGLGNWLDVLRVPASGGLECLVAQREALTVCTHWVGGRTRACGGTSCGLCSRFALRTYTFVGVNVLGLDKKPLKAVLELPGGFSSASRIFCGDYARVGWIVMLSRDGQGRRRRIREDLRGQVKGGVVLPVDVSEIYCSVAGVLGLHVTAQELRGSRGRALSFAAACASQADDIVASLPS